MKIKKDHLHRQLHRMAVILLSVVLLLGILTTVAGCGRKKAQEAAPAAGTSVTSSAAQTESAPAEAEAESISAAVETDRAPAAAETENAPAAVETDSAPAEAESESAPAAEEPPGLREDGEYTGKDEVAAYIHAYGHLPPNYITKKEAENLGWVSNKGNLWNVAPGKSIGGSKFGNYEGNLPEAKGRKYYECDIDYEGGYRGAKRIVFSNDGLIFYTEDHYETFEQLY